MKKKLLSVALATTMIFSSIVPVTAETVTRTYDDGLKGYYTFDDTLANSVSETGTARVHGGAGANWNGGPKSTDETYVAGVNGKAYYFAGDGADVATDETQRGDGLELDAKSTTSEATVSAWISAENFGVGTSSMIFGTGTINTANDVVFSINSLNGYNGSVLLGTIWDWENRGDTFVCLDGDNSGTKFTNNETFVYVTVTVKNGEQKLYFNGVEQASAASTNPLVYNNLKDTSIFLGINWWDASFTGAMDDVVVYDKALSATEVSALYARNGKPYVEETFNVATVGVQKNSAGDKMAFITRVDIDTFNDEEVTDAGVLITKGEVSSLTVQDVDNVNVFKCPTPYLTSDTDAGADNDNYAFRTIVNYPDSVDESTVFTAVPYMVVNGVTVYGDACSMSLADAQ